jgi:hypothetical protein
MITSKTSIHYSLRPQAHLSKKMALLVCASTVAAAAVMIAFVR